MNSFVDIHKELVRIAVLVCDLLAEEFGCKRDWVVNRLGDKYGHGAPLWIAGAVVYDLASSCEMHRADVYYSSHILLIKRCIEELAAAYAGLAAHIQKISSDLMILDAAARLLCE